MNDELVSILIRTINGQFETLKRSIKSISNQLYQNIEVIVIYQGLDDKYYEKIKTLDENFPNLAFQFIQNRTSKDERSKNLNLGIEASNGRYFGVLDDDDIFYNNHVSTLVGLLKNSDNAWACTQTIMGKDMGDKIIEVDKKIQDVQLTENKVPNVNNIFMISFLVDKTKIPKELLKFNENIKFAEDRDFVLALVNNGYNPVCSAEFTSLSTGVKSHRVNHFKYYRAKYKIEIIAELLGILGLIFSLFKEGQKTFMYLFGFKCKLKNIKGVENENS